MGRRSARVLLTALFLGVVACDLSYLGPACTTCDGGLPDATTLDASKDVATESATIDAANDAPPFDAGADATYVSVITQAAPIAWYRFEEALNATVLVDSSGHGHNGNFVSNVSLRQAGIAGSFAVFFDGSTYALVPAAGASVFDFSGVVPFSIELWAKTSVTNNSQTLVSREDDDGGGIKGWDFYVETNGKVSVQREHDNANSDTATTASALPLNQWNQIAFVHDGNNLQVFLNGQLANTTATTVSIPSIYLGLAIASDVPTSPGGDYAGFMDELAFYDRALSVAEILAHYNLGKP